MLPSAKGLTNSIACDTLFQLPSIAGACGKSGISIVPNHLAFSLFQDVIVNCPVLENAFIDHVPPSLLQTRIPYLALAISWSAACLLSGMVLKHCLIHSTSPGSH